MRPKTNIKSIQTMDRENLQTKLLHITKHARKAGGKVMWDKILQALAHADAEPTRYPTQLLY